MEKSKKDLIVRSARDYISRHGMSQAAFARHCGIGASYLSNILNGNYHYRASADKTVEISDRYFTAIAGAIGCELETTFWKIEPTDQFIACISAMETAHAACGSRHGGVRMIIGEKGSGKTTAIDQYCKANPSTTFRLTVNDQDQTHDIIDEIGRLLDVDLPLKRGARLRRIGAELRNRALRGEKNMLIIDEAENTKLPGLRAYKAIYDMITGYAAFVVAGTPDLERSIDRFEARGAHGMPQLKSRLRAARVRLAPIDRSFRPFMYKVEDAALRRLLSQLCTDYRELCDYLEPALVQADRDGVALTDEYFRAMYGIIK